MEIKIKELKKNNLDQSLIKNKKFNLKLLKYFWKVIKNLTDKREEFKRLSIQKNILAS